MKRDVLEELIVVKRSGQRVNFNSYKVAVAVKKAFDSVHNYNEKSVNQVYGNVLTYIETTYSDRKTINVEDIQDIIENQLQEKKYDEVFQAFHEYREKRAASRKVFTIKQQHKFIKAMEKIADDNALKTDNDFTSQDILLHYGKIVADEFAKSYIIDTKYLRSHQEGNIFIHDLEYFPLGIVSHTNIMLEHILKETDSIEEMVQELLNVKGESSGEIHFGALDFLLEPWMMNKIKKIWIEYFTNYIKVSGFSGYVNSKKMVDLMGKETNIPYQNDYTPYILSIPVRTMFEQSYQDGVEKVKEMLQEKIDKLLLKLEQNSHANPRYSFSFGTNDSEIGKFINQAICHSLQTFPPLSKVVAILKQKHKDLTYCDWLCDMLLAQKNIVLSFTESSFNKEEEEVAYFSNGIRIFENYNDHKRSSNGRMVVATTSINMARLALRAEGKTRREFYYHLDEALDLVKNELLSAFETVGNKNKNNFRVLFTGNIMDDEKLEFGQKIRKVIKNGNLHIGLIGLKECVSVLTQDGEEQYHLLLEILKYVQTKCLQFSSETKLNFYMSEPFSCRANRELMALDKAVYGIRKNITEKDTYDLVSQLPSLKEDYHKLGTIQKLFTGGNMIEITLPKNSTYKKVQEVILNLMESDIGFVKLRIGKGETCK